MGNIRKLLLGALILLSILSFLAGVFTTVFVGGLTSKPKELMIVGYSFNGYAVTDKDGGMDISLNADSLGRGSVNMPVTEMRSVFVANGIFRVKFSDGNEKPYPVEKFDLVVEGDQVVLYMPVATVKCNAQKCRVLTLNTPIPESIPGLPNP